MHPIVSTLLCIVAESICCLDQLQETEQYERFVGGRRVFMEHAQLFNLLMHHKECCNYYKILYGALCISMYVTTYSTKSGGPQSLTLLSLVSTHVYNYVIYIKVCISNIRPEPRDSASSPRRSRGLLSRREGLILLIHTEKPCYI